MDGSNILRPDRGGAEAFVTALTGSRDGIVRLRFIHDNDPKREHPAAEDEGRLAQVWPHVLDYQARGYGIFFFVNEIKGGPGSGYGGMATGKDVKRVRALGADFDNGLPEEWGYHEPPSLIIATSTKDGVQRGQALWLVKDCPLDAFREYQQRFAAHYGTDASVCDLPRVFRLPGTLHQKRAPSLVTFAANAPVEARDAAAIMAGIAPAPPRESAAGVEGSPVTLAHLRDLLKHLPDYDDRGPWRDVIAAIRATPVADDPDGALAAAIEYSARWRHWDDKAEVALRSIWETMPPKAGGVGYGTLYHIASENGYSEPPGGKDERRAEDVWAEEVERERAREDFDDFDPTTPQPNPRIRLMSEDEVFSMPDPVELIAGMLMEGERVAIIGPPKVGKTFIGIDICYSLAAPGVTASLHKSEIKKHGPVVYCTGEGHTGFKRRMQAWRAEHGIAPDVKLPFIFNPHVPAAEGRRAEGEQFAAAILEKTGGIKPCAIVVDTLALALGSLSENDTPTANQFFEVADALREKLGCAVIVIGHSKKDDPEMQRGASAFDAGWDVQWTVKLNTETGTLRMRCKMFKDAKRLGPFYYRLKEVQIPDLGAGAVLVAASPEDFKRTTTTLDKRETERHDFYEELSGLGLHGKWMPFDMLVDALMVKRHRVEPADGTPEHREWRENRKELKLTLRNRSRTPTMLYAGFFEQRPVAGKPGDKELYFGLPEEGSAADQGLRRPWFARKEDAAEASDDS